MTVANLLTDSLVNPPDEAFEDFCFLDYINKENKKIKYIVLKIEKKKIPELAKPQTFYALRP